MMSAATTAYRRPRHPRARHAAALLLAAAVAASAQVIKLGTIAPEGSPWHEALLKLDQRWREISGGRVSLRIYAGGVAGDEPDMLRKMKIGQLHAAAMTTASMMSIVPDAESMSLPMMVRTEGEFDYVIRKIGPLLEDMLREKGYNVLGWTSAGWVHFFSKEPVVTPDDMRRRKIFFWGSDTTYVDLLKNSGFHPVPLAVTDLLPSLQTGLVDTFAAPPTAALAFQWFALAPNMTGFRWQVLPSMTVVTGRKWREVPGELRGPLAEAAAEIGRGLQKELRELEVKAIAAMKDHGLQVIEVPDDVVDEWRALVQEKGVPAFVGPRFSREMYDRIVAALAEYRAGQAGEAGP